MTRTVLKFPFTPLERRIMGRAIRAGLPDLVAAVLKSPVCTASDRGLAFLLLDCAASWRRVGDKERHSDSMCRAHGVEERARHAGRWAVLP